VFVLFDVEWLTAEDGTRRITQLAAIRTDEVWRPGEKFNVLVRPEKWDSDWEHLAYSGYSPDEFRNGLSEEDALRKFNHWLKRDDVLCCWHYQNGKTLEGRYEYWFDAGFHCRWAAVNQTVYASFAKKEIQNPGGLYACAHLRGLELPVPEHRSSNDAEVLRSLLQEMHISDGFLTARHRKKVAQKPEELKERRKQNAERILKAQYHYVYLPDSPVFHRWDCKRVLNGRRIMGSLNYKTAARKRRPCLVCRPESGVLTARESAHREEIRQIAQKSAAKKREEAAQNEILDTRLLGGQRVEIRRKLLVGCCHNHIHPGKLTRQLMETHDCIGKQCRFFEKYEDALYWQERAQKAAARQQLKQEKKTQKEREKTSMSYVEEFQTYADDAGYAMKVVRVQEEKTRAFKVFYVSENRFRDGNLFPNFLSRIQKEHPARSILMRHIQDMDGHFVTIEEYSNIRR